MTPDRKENNTALFLREVFTRPWQVGAVVPSSKNLCVAMAKWLPPKVDTCVLELGPGTGAVTQALIDRGLSQERLIAVEKSPILAEHLQQRFPSANIIVGDVLDLDKLIANCMKDVPSFPCVFSSLPLCNFKPEDTNRLTGIIRSLLAPSGKFVQYSYRLAKNRAKSLPNLSYLSSSVIWLNVPPARVSVYQR